MENYSSALILFFYIEN